MASSASLVIWVDAQLPPAIARWLAANERCTAAHIADVGLLQAEDREIFRQAREADVVLLTKDQDFIQLHEQLGSPPRLVWFTCRNLRKAELLALLERSWPLIRELLEGGEALIEVQ